MGKVGRRMRKLRRSHSCRGKLNVIKTCCEVTILGKRFAGALSLIANFWTWELNSLSMSVVTSFQFRAKVMGEICRCADEMLQAR